MVERSFGVSVVRSSFMTVYTWRDGWISGWTSANSLRVNSESFTAESSRIFTETDLRNYAEARQRAISAEAMALRLTRSATCRY